MFQAFPLLIVPILIYSLFALLQMAGGDPGAATQALAHSLVDIPMPSGTSWSVSGGDLIVLLGPFMLFFELIRATNNNKVAIINHSLSMIVFVVALVLFLLVKGYATSVFFLLVMMTLLDVLAGFIVTIVASRRELEIAPAGH